MLKNLLILMVFTIAVALPLAPGQAQSLNDIRNVKIDQLSDEQLQQFLKRAEASGLNQQQLEALAIQRGMPAAEIAKLRKRLLTLKPGKGATSSAFSGGEDRKLNEIAGEDIFSSLETRDTTEVLTEEQKKLFGYSLFHHKKLDFSPNFNMATPKSYVVGPGDELLIEVYGASQQSYNLKVGPEGTIIIPMLGVVSVGGLSIDAASSRLKAKLATIYSTLQGPNPSSFAQITLGNIRTIKVNMVGELEKPGTYSLPSFATVFNALYAAGGPTVKGTFRSIEIYRANKLVSSVDIYDFLVKGQTSQNIRLEDNDFVIVQPARTKVELIGEWKRPGTYEMKEGESMNTLLGFAGGFTASAYTERLSVKRKTGIKLRMEDIAIAQASSFELKNGDEIFAASALELFENRVQLSGAVVRPGAYALTPGLTVKGILEKGGGLLGSAFLTRATLYRTNPDFTLAAQAIDLGAILNGGATDVELRNEDVLNILSVYDLREELFVQVYGEVNQPGVYPYAEGMTVEDLIARASGFKESATSSVLEIARRTGEIGSGRIATILTVKVDNQLKVSGDTNFLKPFDQIFVRSTPGFRKQQLVEVVGELNYPGKYAIDAVNMRVSDLIKRAGGLRPDAYLPGATLVRRTEFFKGLSDTEKERLLMVDLLNSLRSKNELTEAEKLQLNRIDDGLVTMEREKMIAFLEKNINQDDKGIQQGSSQFRQERLVELSESTEGQAKKLQFNKEKELVGIDLEKIITQPGSKFDLILQEGDVLEVPKALQTVRVRGEVLYPSTSVFEGRSDLMNYVSKSGGFSDDARKRKAYVIYPNGKVDRTRSFLFVKSYPKVVPGSEIFVPSKPSRERMSAQGWIGLATSLSTLAIIIRTLIP